MQLAAWSLALSIRLAGPSLHTYCKARSYSPGHRRAVRLSWHTFFFLSVLSSGSLTPVSDFVRHPVSLMNAHLVSQASTQLEHRKTQMSYIILHSFSFILSSLQILPSCFLQCSLPRLSPFQASPPPCALGDGLQCRSPCPGLSSTTMYPSRSSSPRLRIC